MADPTKDDAAAKAKADQDAKAKASATQPADAETLTALAESVKNLEQRTRAAAPAPATEGLDQTTPGGKFRVKGKLVNANGREIDEDGKLLHPEQVQVDAFGRKV